MDAEAIDLGHADCEVCDEVRRLLEQHRVPSPNVAEAFVFAQKQIELEAIRAFVERATDEYNTRNQGSGEHVSYGRVVYDALEEMEKDNAGTND